MTKEMIEALLAEGEIVGSEAFMSDDGKVCIAVRIDIREKDGTERSMQFQSDTTVDHLVIKSIT